MAHLLVIYEKMHTRFRTHVPGTVASHHLHLNVSYYRGASEWDVRNIGDESDLLLEVHHEVGSPSFSHSITIAVM